MNISSTGDVFLDMMPNTQIDQIDLSESTLEAIQLLIGLRPFERIVSIGRVEEILIVNTNKRFDELCCREEVIQLAQEIDRRARADRIERIARIKTM